MERLEFKKDLETIEITEHGGASSWSITLSPDFEKIGKNIGKCAIKPEVHGFFYFITDKADNQQRFYHLAVNTILAVVKADSMVLKASSVENIRYFNSNVVCGVMEEIKLLHGSDNDNDISLSQQDLEYLLEGCFSCYTMKIYVRAADNVRYHGFLRHKDMKLKNANWLSVDNILEMSCESLSVEGATLSVQDFNRFLKTWRLGGLNRLDRCRIQLADDYHFINVMEVMEGIETTDWIPPLISWHEGPRVQRFAEWRIRRDDGKWGIVLMAWNMVRFHIWHTELIN